MLSPKLVEKFWANVEKTDACWLWKGTVRGNMPQLSVGNYYTGDLESGPARHISLQIAGRPPAPKVVVLDTCENSLCVNPDHLIFGDEARFWQYVQKTETCWLWTGSTDANGYGRFTAVYLDGRRRSSTSHRYSYELHYGKIPDGMLACHKCDRPGCLNPSHLFLGTEQDNNRDKIKKNRHRKADGSQTILTDEDVKTIKQTSNLVQLATEMGVSPRCILNIMLGKSWKHIK
jgi:hypothetical protein